MTYLTAHSGSDGTTENSLSFIAYFKDKEAIAAVELDIRLDQEQQLVLNHDALVDGQDYLTLAEVFEYVVETKTSLGLNCDLKEPGLEAQVYELAQGYQLWPQIQLSGAVAPAYLKLWPRQILMNLENAPGFADWPRERQPALADIMGALSELHALSAEIINLNYRDAKAEVLQKGAELGLLFSVWTVNDWALIKDYQRRGLYNITSRQAWAFVAEGGGADETLKPETLVP